MTLIGKTDEYIKSIFAQLNPAEAPELTNKANISLSRSSVIDLMEQGGVSFRLNSGSLIDLSDVKPLAEKKQLSYAGMMLDDSEYFADDLPPGVHVILGQPGSGKSGFSRLLMERYQIPLFTIFERTISADRSSHSSELLVPGSALNVREITEAFKLALSKPGAIIDSIRFIGLMATGFPAITSGVNSGIFAFCQWLNIVAERIGSRLFVVVSTERKDPQIVALYEDYLTGACNSVLTLSGLGACGLTRADKARVGKVMTTFKNDFDWIADSSSDTTLTGESNSERKSKFLLKDK